jgi:hypothetical protein
MAANGSSAVAAMEGPSTASAFAKRRVNLKYFSHAVEDMGTNESGKTPTETEVGTYLRQRKLWTALRSGDSRIRHVTVVPLLCRATSSDSWATAANQTPMAGFATGGVFRVPLNAHLAQSLAAREVDALFDMNAVVAHSAAPDK